MVSVGWDELREKERHRLSSMPTSELRSAAHKFSTLNINLRYKVAEIAVRDFRLVNRWGVL
jgi:hypothetical protein